MTEYKNEKELKELLDEMRLEMDSVSSREPFVFNRRDPYYIRDDEEDVWRDILKYHNKPYYPRNEKMDAETTFQKLRGYLEQTIGNDIYKPPYARLRKLEAELERINTLLLTVDNIDDKERKRLEERKKYCEAKLKIRQNY